jgi:hypothetical protein
MKEGAQVDVAYQLGQIDGKLDQLIAQDFDGRIASLEQWKARAGGGGAVILFLITAWELLRYVHVLK